MLHRLDAETRWDRTLAAFHGGQRGYPHDVHDPHDHWDLYEWRRPSGLFAAGDIVIGSYTNGQAERLAVYGFSSKGRTVRRLIVQFQRWLSRPGRRRFGYIEGAGRIGPRIQARQPPWQYDAQPRRHERFDNRTPIFYVELPHPLRAIRALSGLPVADAEVRRFVVERLRAAGSAHPVGASSGASL